MTEQWRYRCPEGHTTIREVVSRGVVVCRTCDREYGFKVDVKHDKRVYV